MTPILIVIALVVLAVVAYLIWSGYFSGAGNQFSSPESGMQQPSNEWRELDERTGPVLVSDNAFDSGHAHYLGTACDIAYQPSSTGTPNYRKTLNLSTRLISVDNTQAYVGENVGSIVVAFRGSQSPTSIDGFKDWLLTNARNFLVLPEGRIGTDFAAAGVGARFHRGFMEALAEVWDPLYATVDEAMRRQERPLWITGHSLGGAIALLAAWRLHQKFIPIHQICTFGAPMVGNAAAAEAYHREFPGKIVRYVDFGDMVPRLPTMSLLNNHYDHVQREIVVGREGDRSADGFLASIAEQTPDGEVNERAADSLWGELHSGIEAHLMDNYISRLNEQVG